LRSVARITLIVGFALWAAGWVGFVTFAYDTISLGEDEVEALTELPPGEPLDLTLDVPTEVVVFAERDPDAEPDAGAAGTWTELAERVDVTVVDAFGGPQQVVTQDNELRYRRSDAAGPTDGWAVARADLPAGSYQLVATSAAPEVVALTWGEHPDQPLGGALVWVGAGLAGALLVVVALVMRARAS
jgi:hypothetical protein